MREIGEEQIFSWAPNPAAVANARKIKAKGGFTELFRLEDESLYWGKCQGSGKSSYDVSVDFSGGAEPVFRCSCPSRQFPCKHCLALLCEIAAGAAFTIGRIPEEIEEKRKKREASAVKKAEKERRAEKDTGGGAAAKKKTRNSAARKKTEKQLEGLLLLKQLITSLLTNGLASLNGVSLKQYRELAKQLGDYYLPGPLVGLKRLIRAMELCQETGDEKYYQEAVKILIRLQALEKKSTEYLRKRQDSGEEGWENTILFEELGGIWKRSQLEELGCEKEDVRLVQLSFRVYYDEARKEYVDEGYWADVDTGEISVTRNYRPLRALQHVKQEDSCFSLVKAPNMVYYPGEGNRRIRWEGESRETLTPDVCRKLRDRAWRSIPEVVKAVKNRIKNILSEDEEGILLAFDGIGKIEEEENICYFVKDKEGNALRLQDLPGQEGAVEMLKWLPDGGILKEQVLFGKLYYEPESGHMCLAPFSILTEEQIIRLLY
ncbi:MAG: SWIM zinc finger family protein [Lachnospiraceae bacterium]|nr:SWIM zinc finger family protein [Lachnospiraceae bacterium]